MTENHSQTIDLRDALDKHLNARSLSKSIGTLLQNKRKTIDFDPYYQRNYVWDIDKRSFFIESILLGIEIPPLIMFIPDNDKKKYEVIDGRQRFETLKRFFEGDFKLNKKGLRRLSSLKGLNFQHLKPEIQRVFLNTTIRIIEFSTIGEYPQQNELEDRIKKEIFWRYNSGITPLKTIEVQRAYHLEDDFTQLMEDEFADEPRWLEQFKQVFFAKAIPTTVMDEESQAKIRELLVLEHFPINIYASTSSRRDTVEWLYDLYIERAENQEEILQAFIRKIGILYNLANALKETEWMIYQGVYWAMVILEQNEIELGVFFNNEVINHLASEIKKNIDFFTSDKRGFSSVTNQRFQCLSDFFKTELLKHGAKPVDFSPYLKSSLAHIRHEQKADDIEGSIRELNTMRLTRPDAVTKTIEDLTGDMNTNTFLIRPAYQRQEVINIRKASGIIESMLLGIPLPTIFIFRRKDGTCEVVDGQQRLLSILGFMGKSYINSNKEEAWSEKNHYRLSKGIAIFKEFGGRKYNELEEKWKDRLLDFELSLVYIDEDLNEKFDPIDLFVRLNNKPYPVKNHSFEMWNSYSERSIIKKIQKITGNHDSWFYYRKDNKRMNNEELLTIFSYLSFETRQGIGKVFDSVDIYNWSPRPLTFRLSKILISEWLNTAEGQQNIEQQDKVLECIDDVENFIYKAEILTHSLQQPMEDESEAFNSLLSVKGKVRRLKPFYLLWFLLLGIDKQTIDQQASVIAKAIKTFFDDNQIIVKDNQQSVKDIFRKNIEDFWTRFKSN